MKRLSHRSPSPPPPLLASACHVGGNAEARDAGPAANRTYQVGAFDRIAVAGPYEVSVATGGEPGRAAPAAAQTSSTKPKSSVENGELKIRPKNAAASLELGQRRQGA